MSRLFCEHVVCLSVMLVNCDHLVQQKVEGAHDRIDILATSM